MAASRGAQVDGPCGGASDQWTPRRHAEATGTCRSAGPIGLYGTRLLARSTSVTGSTTTSRNPPAPTRRLLPLTIQQQQY